MRGGKYLIVKSKITKSTVKKLYLCKLIFLNHNKTKYEF